MEELSLISRGLYKVVSEELGTEKIVDMRRRVMKLEESLKTASCTSYIDNFENRILSGSMCEGFRFSSSDVDTMWVLRGIRVIFNTRDNKCNDEHTMIQADSETTKPGFALLRLLNDKSLSKLKNACVKYGERHYVSSSKWRDLFTSANKSFITHGPCSTAMVGVTEQDFAFCLKSDRLPEAAHGFLRRIHVTGWPDIILQEIVKSGCHFVAIGAKESVTETLEWRISFSFTEKLLIHSMTHVQFLCYGLLKIFLKEVIDVNMEIKGLLCSYFLKTALFWEISNSSITWDSSNFLACFWVCFQRLLHWINNEYCPNFFIPENNMFAGKIHGAARARLLSCLIPLYQDGCYCLIRCPTIQNELYTIIQHPLSVHTMQLDEETDKCTIETELILEIWNYKPMFPLEYSKGINCIQNIDHLISTNNTDLERSILQIWKNYICQILALLSPNTIRSEDNEHNQSDQTCEMEMPEMDITRHLLYKALCYYWRGDYRSAIGFLQEAKVKLQHPHIIYPWCLSVAKYRTAGGEHKPFTQIMKEIVVWPVQLNTNITVPELSLEHQAATNHFTDNLLMPPLVMTNFLSFLSYHYLQKIRDSRSALQELTMLVHYDDGYHIHATMKAISWQVLGICQQMSGDRLGAYQSYTNALQQTWCEVGLASLVRIRSRRLKWAIVIARRPSSVRPSSSSGVRRPSSSVNFSHFQLLLQNRLMDFDESW